MNRNEIEQLTRSAKFPDACKNPDLLETHTSWLIKTDQFVYKIKKQVRFSFLDFSTLRKRAFYCRREVLLNSRWAEGVYIGHVPIYRQGDNYFLGKDPKLGEPVEYAVQMYRLPDERHLPNLLKSGRVSEQQMRELGAFLARIHHDAPPVHIDQPLRLMRLHFNDLETIVPAIRHWPSVYRKVLGALLISDRFLTRYGHLIEHRAATNWFRDTHGDLHIGNVFLTDPPRFFGCVEFNDQLRQIDVLDELAFLSMDLEAYGYPELSRAFQDGYRQAFPAGLSRGDNLLFTYYQLYRANVRLKVAVLNIQNGEVYPELRNRIYRYAGMLVQYTEKLEAAIPHQSVA
jgi:aminoglycoside phosphotransferase family enzyme